MVTPRDEIERGRRDEQTRMRELRAVLGELPSASLPVTLLPVHLETRFVRGESGTELLIRVYPDDLHLDTHEPELTQEEARWGKHFWEQSWRAGRGSDDHAGALRMRAWAQLAQRFGPERAAWIATVLEPLNPDDRPETPVPDEQPLPRAPDFPEVAPRDGSWTRAPRTRVLPDRWAAFGYRGGERVLLEWGEPIPDELAAGPSPGAPPPDRLADDTLVVDEGMRWLVNFEEAERIGMALRVPLEPEEARLGFDTLFVLGLKASLGAAESADRLAALMAAQHYTDGLAFVPQGTPTNNTSEGPAGYASSDPGYAMSYQVERGGPLFRPGSGANGDVTAQALGIDPQVFFRVRYAGDKEQADARHMNAALWPATWGYFLEQMMDDTFSEQAIADGRRHFIDHVRGRGPLPALRVGNQPYGLLAATSLERWKPLEGSDADARVVSFLRSVRHLWSSALPRLPRLGQTGDREGAGEDLLHILGMEATSNGYAARLILDFLYFSHLVVRGDAEGLSQRVSQQLRAAPDALRALGLDWDPRLVRTSFARHAFPLSAPLVQAGRTSEAETLDPNYIAWLRDSDYESIRDETRPGAGPDSLLYLLLRHATSLAYASTAYRIQRSEGLTGHARHREPALVDLSEGARAGEPQRTRTIGRSLARQVAGLGEGPIGGFIHELGRADHPEAAVLDELRESLDHLESMSTAALEQALTETLDVCSHRLDAWITSFAAKRLNWLRGQQPSGIHLGGYGWVEDLRPAPARSPVDPPQEEQGSPIYTADDNAGYVHAPSLNHAATAAILRSGYLSHRGEGQDHPFAVDLSSERVRLAQWLLDGVRQGQPLAALLGYRFERGLHEQRLSEYIDPFRRLAPFGELYKARLAVQVAACEVKRLEAAPHPGLPEAREKLQAAEQLLAGLRGEHDSLPGRLARARADKDAAEKRKQEAENEIARLFNISLHSGNPPNPSMLAAARAEASAAREAIERAEARIERLKRRKEDLPAEIDNAELNVRAARRDVTDLEDRDHPDLAAAKDGLRAAREHLDELLQRHRQRFLYPPTAGIEAMESIAARRVVDGLVLVRRWQAGEIPWGEQPASGGTALPRRGTDAFRALTAELGSLADAVDAMSDALTAESVFQAVQGNPMRSGATLDAASRGEAPPPELEVTRTPRSGIGLTHRILVLFTGEPADTPSWPTGTHPVRARAEPHLNAWAARLLGDPSRVRCRADYLHPRTGAVVGAREVRLSELGLSPLDALYAAQGHEQARHSELEQRLVYHSMRSRPTDIPADVGVRLTFARGDDWEADDVGFAEFVEVARTAAKVVTGARPAEARDVSLPEAAAPANVDTQELRGRADAAVEEFRGVHAQLQRLLESAGNADLEGLRGALVSMAHFGIQGAFPLSPAGDTPNDRETLLAQCRSVDKEASRRLDRLRDAEDAFDRNTAPREVEQEHDLGRLRDVFGAGFRVLPHFEPEQAAELSRAFAGSDAVQDGDPLAAVTWFQRVARIRDGAASLSDALLYAEALGSSTLDFQVGQLPHREGDRWAALPRSSGEPIAGGRLSLVAHAPAGLDAAELLAGLLIDEWTEVVPNANETTGVAFNFDQPSARPPQAILLAVPPDGREDWDLETLEGIVLETLELAKLRAVDPDALADVAEIGHFLPALYFAINLAGDTVSTDFTRATGVA